MRLGRVSTRNREGVRDSENVSSVRDFPIIAKGLFCSDLHLRHSPPKIRKKENWYEVQKRYLDELKSLSLEFNCPIFVAGDILHTYENPSELINFLLDNMPCVYGIPGQHDLPYHSYDQIHRSSYQTLVKAKKIIPVFPDHPIDFGTFTVHGFPWGYTAEAPEKMHSLSLQIAIVHSYIWKKNHHFYGAPEKDNWENYAQKLKGFDVVFFGDNHSAFTVKDGDLTIVNCGTFMRQKEDEIDYDPSVWLLDADGSVQRILLKSCKEDVFLEGEKLIRVEKKNDKFIESIMQTESETVDFKDVLNRTMDRKNVSQEVREIVLKSIPE